MSDSKSSGRLRSYDLKVDRAEKHLVELEFEIRRYARRHPYLVRKGVEGKRDVYRFEFAQQPDEELAVIVGDFLYNIHSALNHLAAALVPSAKRSRVAFPIFWQGVWEDSTEGENAQRVKDRERWLSYTRNMPDEAVTILKANQPPDLGPNVENTHALTMLNRLRNADAHTKLVAVASSLRHPILRCEAPNGALSDLSDPSFGGDEGLVDGAEISGIPEGTVNVDIQGLPAVAIRVGQLKGGYAVSEAFRESLLNGARMLIEQLRPYDRL